MKKIAIFLETPNEFRETRGDFDTKETYRELINKKLPDMNKDIVNIIVKDLFDSGLITISIPGLDNHPSFGEEGVSRLSSLGKQFVEFITRPTI